VPLQNRNSHGQAIHARTTLNIADAQTDARLPEASHAMARARGFHGQVVLPLLRHDEALGAIGVSRREPGEFTDDEIALLQTFADQAVIAIENVRLFKELEARTHDLTRSVGKLQALGEVGQAISSTLDLQTVLGTIVGRAVQLSESDAGVIYEYNEEREVFVPRATEHLEAEILETMLATPVRKGEGRPDGWPRRRSRSRCQISWQHPPRAAYVARSCVRDTALCSLFRWFARVGCSAVSP
jgi:GAF domain-containing protein